MKVKIIIALVALAINGTTIMAQEKIKQTAGRGTVRTSLDCATEVW